MFSDEAPKHLLILSYQSICLHSYSEERLPDFSRQAAPRWDTRFQRFVVLLGLDKPVQSILKRPAKEDNRYVPGRSSPLAWRWHLRNLSGTTILLALQTLIDRKSME